jgi:hypothetical protein
MKDGPGIRTVLSPADCLQRALELQGELLTLLKTSRPK